MNGKDRSCREKRRGSKEIVVRKRKGKTLKFS